MAKRKKSARRSSGIYRPDTLGIKYNSLTFLLFSVFVLIVTMIIVSQMFGFRLY